MLEKFVELGSVSENGRQFTFYYRTENGDRKRLAIPAHAPQKNVCPKSREHDPVKAPAHYTAFPVEPINIYLHLGYALGNVVKYVLRAPRKGGVEDLDKALQFLEWEEKTPFPLLDLSSYRALARPLEELSEHLKSGPGFVERLQGSFLLALDAYLDGSDVYFSDKSTHPGKCDLESLAAMREYILAMREYILALRKELEGVTP